MKLRRPRIGEIVAAVAGVTLVVSLFLPWYGDGAGAENSGWAALRALDVLLLAIALAGMALLALQVGGATTAITTAWASMTALVGTLTLPWVLYRMLDLPEAAAGLGLRFALLGLIAAAGVALGAWLSMRDEGFGLRPSPGIEATMGPDGRAAEAELVALPGDGPREGRSS